MEFYNVFNQDYVRVARRADKYPVTKLELLDEQEYTLSELSDEIIVDSDSIDISYNQGTQGKCSFSVANYDGKYTPNENSPFWYGKKLRYWKGLKDITNGDIYYFSKGVYIVTGVSASDNTVDVSCVDKFGAFTSDTGASCLHTSAKMEAGKNIGTAIVDLLSMDKGNGRPLDSVKPIIDYDIRQQLLGQDIEVSSGTYIGDFFIELSNTTKCRIKYDGFGRFRMTTGSLDYEYKNKASVWDFREDYMADHLNVTAEYNFPDVKNRVTVWGENFEGQSFVAAVENHDPSSPVCIEKVGYRVAETREDMFGYEQENVDAFAEMFLKMKTIQGISAKIDCPIIPHIEVEDCVAITNEKLMFDEKRFFVSGIAYNGETMTISLTNIDNLPYQVELN